MNRIWCGFGLLAGLLFSRAGITQTNLVLNGGFEDINTCTEYKSECGVEGWFYLKEVKVQMLLNESNTGLLGANSYGLFCTWKGDSSFTPVIGTLLPCGLQKGKSYTFKGLLSAKLHPKLILQPGVCLGDKYFVPGRPFSRDLKPQVISAVSPVPNTPFFSFEYTFIAGGNEEYLTFGTFTKEDTSGAKKRLFGVQTISLVLDNFQLLPGDTNETVCPDFGLNRDHIYAYDYRHREMDYSLYGKGVLEIEQNKDEKRRRTGSLPPETPPARPDTLKLGDVFFDFNKSTLKTEAKKMLARYFTGTAPQKRIDSLYIEGHTDSIGSDKQNLLLSTQRCQAVQGWLLQQQVITREQSSIRAYGRSRPVASNKTPAGRALNRRVEIIIFRRKE